MAYLILNGDNQDSEHGNVQYYEFNPNDHTTLRVIEDFLLRRSICSEDRSAIVDTLFDDMVQEHSSSFLKKITTLEEKRKVLSVTHEVAR